MTDDEHQNRRLQDPKLDEILKNQATHLEKYHVISPEEAEALVEEHEYMVLGLKEGRRDISRLLVVVEGIPDFNANGEVIGYIGGMRGDIADLKDKANGGGGFSIRARDKAQIIGILTAITIVLERIVHLL